ncbi:MAG: hypothetical protein ACAI37_03825 [Chthoniobacter sp.]
MKAKQILTIGVAAILFSVAKVDVSHAQPTAVPTTTVQSVGTVSAFSSGSIAIRPEQGDKPVRYSSSSTTTFMDENGAPVPLVMLKAGVPVTVDYVRLGDRLIARRVIVLRSLAVGPAIVEKKAIMTASVETN